jgi:thiol:disulfide interchange protein DsbA
MLAFLASAGCGEAPEPQAQGATAEARTQTPAAQTQAAAQIDVAETQGAEAAASEPRTAADGRAEPAVARTDDAAAAEPGRIELAQADAEDALAAAGYRDGVHFQRLSPTQPTSSGPDQVEVAEFFMYSCIHCYNFEPYIQQWLPTKADYVNFVRVPTVWNELVRLHAQAFYAAEALGKGEEMHTPFFRSMHVDGNYLQTEPEIASFFARFGVDREEFESAFESFSVHAKVQRADELARRYRVSSTPTVVVNGKYVTNASMAGGYDQLLDLIDTLAAAERGP